MISDLSKVWVYADIYEYEISWVRVGDKVEMTLAGVPGKTFEGRLSYIYPYAEAKTRSIKVRLEFDNPERSLRPDMFAEVSIHAEERAESGLFESDTVLAGKQSLDLHGGHAAEVAVHEDRSLSGLRTYRHVAQAHPARVGARENSENESADSREGKGHEEGEAARAHSRSPSTASTAGASLSRCASLSEGSS